MRSNGGGGCVPCSTYLVQLPRAPCHPVEKRAVLLPQDGLHPLRVPASTVAAAAAAVAGRPGGGASGPGMMASATAGPARASFCLPPRAAERIVLGAPLAVSFAGFGGVKAVVVVVVVVRVERVVSPVESVERVVVDGHEGLFRGG